MIEKKIKTSEDLVKLFHEIHNLLRNSEGMSEQTAMSQFNIIFSLKLLEKQIKNKQIDLSNECLFSKISDIIDEEQLYVHVKEVVLTEISKSKYGYLLFQELEINNVRTLYTIVQNINKIDYDNLDEDLRGKLYEYFIGREKDTISGLGQFFTNREIVNCFVHYCDKMGFLELDKNGNIPTICDPTCGTYNRNMLKHMMSVHNVLKILL